ncbi:GSCFA domain-containing protein [uncultured Psychroserpens sp.]|uniref:GSCFA domain-containing protein n=1 Tax=uncultured Psychroserpens sp. TaxID=255436 RepID=UPI00260FC8F4|nr:GSCFA domain-containing protein [uncultured Psychroserpens sp.]
MDLQTKILLSKQQHNQIDYQSKIVLLGSCFAEHITDKFTYFKFREFKNPFGILFHPLAIENLISNSINKKVYTKADVFLHNEQWHCFEAHSKLSDSSKEHLLFNLNTNVKQTLKHLNEATHLIITLGTAWAYRYIESDKYVANCHKVPQKKFLKELLSPKTILASLDRMITLLKSINPEVSILFTVSPIRHVKDGFVENTLSKSHLITAIHQVVDSRHQLYYFPSYEIMMDELRDYRFYDEDMLHPNQTAINYIWNAFKKVWISSEAQLTMTEIDAIQKGLLHRPFNPNSEAHQAFLQKLTKKQVEIQSIHKHIRF